MVISEGETLHFFFLALSYEGEEKLGPSEIISNFLGVKS